MGGLIEDLLYINILLAQQLGGGKWWLVVAGGGHACRVVKSSRLLVKITAYLVSIGRLLCLAFLYGWHFLHKISLDWLLTLTTQ